ncbi:MAG: hypothetical protein ACLGQW_08950 [Acidobacteriota bacterium]
MNYSDVCLASSDAGRELVVVDYPAFGLFAVNAKVPLRVTQVSGSIPPGSFVDVNIGGTFAGLLYVLDSACEYLPSALSDYQYAAYLADTSFEDFNRPFIFKHSYFVVDEGELPGFLASYAASSSIWGGFVLDVSGGINVVREICPVPGSIQAIQLSLPSLHHTMLANLSTFQFSAFDRFLRLYQLLELSFDQRLVQQIQALGDDLFGIGQLLSTYSSSELDRLKAIVGPRITNNNVIISCLDDVLPFKDIASKLLYEYNKKGFTLTLAEFESGVARGFAAAFAGQNISKLVPFVCYVLYRVRCSIAHQRIGEFIFSHNDEKFIICFAEPLLRQVLIQVLAV